MSFADKRKTSQGSKSTTGFASMKRSAQEIQQTASQIREARDLENFRAVSAGNLMPNLPSRIGSTAPQMQFSEPIQIGKRSTTPTQIYEEAIEVGTPTNLDQAITSTLQKKAQTQQQLNTYSFENNGVIDQTLANQLKSLEAEVDRLENIRSEQAGAAAQKAQQEKIKSYVDKSGLGDKYFTQSNLKARQAELEKEKKRLENELAKMGSNTYDAMLDTDGKQLAEKDRVSKELEDVKAEMRFIANSYSGLRDADTQHKVTTTAQSQYEARRTADSVLDAVAKLLDAPHAGISAAEQNDAVQKIESATGLSLNSFGGDVQAFARAAQSQAVAGVAESKKAWEKAGLSSDEYASMVRMESDKAHQQASEANAKKVTEFAEEYPTLASVLSIVASPAQGVDFINQTLRYAEGSNVSNLDTYVPADSSHMTVTNFVTGIRSTVGGRLADQYTAEVLDQNVAEFLYNTGMSAADSMAQVATFGPASIYVMGLSSAANTAKAVIDSGGTNGQAFAMGIAAGVTEALCEKVSVDKLLDMLTADNVESIAQAIGKVLSQTGSEASEEFITEIANTIAEAYIMEGESAFRKKVADYSKNMEERDAVNKALGDVLIQAGISGIAGALSGFVSGAAAMGAHVVPTAEGALPWVAPKKAARKVTTTVETASPAAAPEVQQLTQQAEATKQQNPEVNVLDAATTLFVNEQGCNLKTAEIRAGIVQKLITGEEVSDKVLKRIEPTSKITQRIFTQLTGVQFPEGPAGIEKLMPIFRTAHEVAVQAQQAQVQMAQQEAPITSTGVAERVAQAQQVVEQVAPETDDVVSFEDFTEQAQQIPEMASLHPEVLEVAYAQWLQDTGVTVAVNGEDMSFAGFVNYLRSTPEGATLTVGEMGRQFQQLANQQNMNKEANYGSDRQQGVSGQSQVQHGGQSGQSGERTGVAAAGLAQGAGVQEGAGSQSDGADARGYGEVSRGPVNTDAVASDRETHFVEVNKEAWSEKAKEQEKKFSRVGISMRIALGQIPIPGTTRSCDGVSLLGIESIIQSDSPFFDLEQLCDHEVGHQYFFRDPALYQKCAREFRLRTSKAQRAELMKTYLGSYAGVYAQKTAKEQAKIQAAITEEIICDAYAGMNRNGSNADQLQEFIKPIIDDWCAARDAELESAEKRYSIDSMAEAVGLTFEKDGQMTVFKDGSGNRVDEVTEKMVQTSPLGAVIQSAVDKKFITDADAKKQITFFTELYNLMLKTQDIDLLWAVSSSIGFQPIEAGPRDPASLNQKSKFAGYTKNSDPQYSTTVDFTTICLKTQAVIDAMSATMMELGHGLTEDEIVNIVYRNTHDAGEPVPCPVCYVFSRWVGLGGLFDNMNNLQTQYANADLEVLRADIETLSQRIDEIMVKRGYALATGKGGSKSYVLPNSSTKKSFGDAKIVMEKELMARQLELQAKQNQDMVSGKKTMTKAEEAELAALKRDIQILDNWTWLTDVRLSENYTPVPPEILFDINAGKEFAERYPESWKFRTTRGPAMGKAATPYADEHLGQILRGAGTSDLKKAELGDPAKNPFLKSKNGKLTPAAEKALQKSIAKIKAQNLLNGQRYQSTSDFRFEYALDYLLSFVEMQALGGKVQLYTKVAEAVRMFASIGAEVNCSLMPLGIGYRVNKDGSKTLIFSSVTGMNAEDAFNLSNEFDNVQPIMVGIGNEHIRLCMADDRITFIIPYHASGAGEARYVALMDIVGEHVEEREDYSNYQTDHKIEEPTKAQKAAYDLRLKLLTGKLGILSDADKQVLRDNEILHNLYKRFYGKDMDGNISDIDPKYLNPATRDSGKLFRDNECYGAFLTSEQAKNVMPFEYWDRTSTIDQADQQGQAFVDYCESLGLRPRFSGWDGNGVYHAEFDFSKESGYWKMLIDRSVYNRDGSYHEQQAINVTNFDAGFLLREESVKGIVQPSLVNDPAKTEKIAQKSADQVREKRGEKKFSVTESDLADVVETAEGARSAQVRYSIVTDPETIQKLEDDEYMVVYKAMQVIDGKLYPPMSAEVEVEETYTDKKGRQKTEKVRKLKQHSILGRWQQSDEAPDAIKSFAKPTKKYPEGYGRFDLLKGTGNKKDDLPKVAYNPYEHTSNIVMNDQFSTAYKRDNLVTVEYHIPMSEVNGVWDANMQPTNQRYKAQYAKDPVGLADWKAGGVAQKLKHSHRDVYLTRWSKPIRVLDDAEVAQKYKEILDKEKGIVIPWNVVTPSLRYELEKIGVPIDYSDVMGSVVRKFAEEFPDDYAKLPKPIQRKAEIESARKAEESRIKAEKEASKKAAKEAEKKYSVIDSSGRALTEDQQKYFTKSKARDYMGRLMTMFHGTESFGFTVFDPEFSDDGISLFFTNNPAVARSYSGTEENDIRALSKDTNMAVYQRKMEIHNLQTAFKFLDAQGIKKVAPNPVADSVLLERVDLWTEETLEESEEWLAALRESDNEQGTISNLLTMSDLEDNLQMLQFHRDHEDYLSQARTALRIAKEFNWIRRQIEDDTKWGLHEPEVGEGLATMLEGVTRQIPNLTNLINVLKSDSDVYAMLDPELGFTYMSDRMIVTKAEEIRKANLDGLYEVYVNVENPLVVDANYREWNDLVWDVRFDRDSPEWDGDTTREIAAWAKEHGYDGVLFRNLVDIGAYDDGDAGASDIVIAFKSEQVKSTANKNPTTNPDIRYSVTPAFEKWYQETYNEELTSSQLKRRLQTAERRAEQAEHNRKAAELKNTFDKEMNLTAWMMHHTKKMREQKRTMNEKLAEARKEKTEAVRAAVAETKEIERAKAAVQHDADRMAERRNAAKRLRIREDAYKQKVTEMKENQKLKRNAARAVLRDSKLAAKRRAEIETEQGLVDTIRKNPKQRTGVEKLQDAAQVLRTLGRSAYRNFVNMAEAIDRFSKRQAEGMRAGTLVNILGGTASTVESMFKKGLVDRAGNRIGESMSDVFLCWDEAHKNVDEELQAVLQDFMLHRHNIDRMSIVARAESALETFENTHEWLRDMDPKEFARLVAMTEKEAEKSGKQQAQLQAVQYARLIREYNEAQNKPIFADDKGNPVTAETSQKMVDKYIAENPWLLEKANGIYEWWDKFMREWAVGDTISEAEYSRMRQMYPHYVPTYRTTHNGVGGAGFVGNGAASVSKAVKKAKGSTEEVMNIEDSFSNLVSKIVRLNRLNEMYMNIIDTAMLDEDGLFSDMAYFDWDWQAGQYGNALVTGSADIVDLTDTVAETEKTGLEKVGPDEYKLTAWRNGRKYTAYISKDLYQSIGNVTGHLANDLEEGLLKIGNTLTGPMKTAITGINPTFAVRNLSRDLPTAIINSISGLAFPKYYAQAMQEIAQNSEHWQQFQALGGTNATYYNDSQGFAKSIAKGKNVVSKGVDAMGKLNEVTESQTRFAEYLATIDKLGDTYENRLQGIKNSAEVTVDFSRKGRYGKVINAWVPYWNPAVQGIDKTVRSLIESPDGAAIWKQASRTLSRAAMTTILFEAIQYAVLKALGRDDEWEELNDRTKDTYYCIPLKDSKTFLKIPKNREWGAILGTPFMRMLEYANGREDPFENYIETSIEPNFLPPAIFRPDAGGGFTSDIIGVSQALDLAKNEDFAGRTIVPYSYQQGTLSQQYDSETSWFAKQLGDLLNWSPMQIDYILGDYFGDFGRMFIQATSKATLTGEQNLGKAALDIVTNPFVADARYSSYAVNKYYDLMDDLDRVVQDRKNQLGTDGAKETLEYQTQKAVDTLYGKAITELNREVREMADGPEKDAAKEQIAQLAADAVEFYNDSISGKIPQPELTANYANYSQIVSDELIQMNELAKEYNFKPRTSAPESYVDPRNKKNEFVLTEEQQEYYMELYTEAYDEAFERVIQSSRYKNAKPERKAAMLEDVKQDVADTAKEELIDWLRKNGIRSTPKK